MNGLSFNCNVDLVLCIDATGSMSPVIQMVKDTASSFYEKIVDALGEKKRIVSHFRVKVMVFRDFYCDGPAALEESDFFTLPGETQAFKEFVSPIEAKWGGDEPENALEAISIAMNSDWVREGQRQRHIIMVWTDASAHPLEKAKLDRNEYYPKGMPESYQEISDWWNGGEKMANRAKRLIVFAPDAYPWTDIAAEWSSVVHIASKAGEGLREVELEVVLACIAGSI